MKKLFIHFSIIFFVITCVACNTKESNTSDTSNEKNINSDVNVTTDSTNKKSLLSSSKSDTNNFRNSFTFNANNLHMNKLTEEVVIDFHDKKTIDVSIQGTAEAIKNIKCSLSNNTVLITSTTLKNNQNKTIIQSKHNGDDIIVKDVTIEGNSNIVIVDGNIISTDNSNQAKIIIMLPKGTTIKSESTYGNITIGDIESNVDININSGFVKVGSTKSAKLSVQGSGDISIYKITGNVNAIVQGSGDITIPNGNSNSFVATVQGSGDIHFGGTTQSTLLTVQGSGDIYVAKSKQQPVIIQQGSGDIKVKNW